MMDKQQRAAAYRLLAAVELDRILKEDCTVYGNWYQHLYDHVTDDSEEDTDN